MSLARLKFRLLVFSRLVWHSIARTDDDFWVWLYLRVTDPTSRDYQDDNLSLFLVASAGKLGHHERMCGAYDRFANTLDLEDYPEVLPVLLVSAKVLGRTDIENTVTALMPDTNGTSDH